MTAPTTPTPADPGRAGGQPIPGARPMPPGSPAMPPTTVATGPGQPGGPGRPGQPGGPGQPPGPGKDDKSQKRWTMTERLLAVLAALLSVVAGALGIWGSDAASERDDLETTADSLVEERDALRDERDQLGADLDDAQAEIARLEDSATTTTTAPDTTTTTDADGNAPPLPGEPVFLNQLEPVAGNANIEETELGGQRYRNVVRLDTRECSLSPDMVEYNLGAGYERFTTLAGLHDTIVQPDDVWRFVVTTIDANGDHIVFEQEVRFAQPVEVDVSVAGAQRLRLTIESVDVDGERGCAEEDDPATWADPQLT